MRKSGYPNPETDHTALCGNAIYHGLEPKFGKGSLTVTGVKEDGYIVFQVTDDGVGIDEDVDIMKGYAVSNVYQRLKLHYWRESGA